MPFSVKLNRFIRSEFGFGKPGRFRLQALGSLT